jgi:hypothetical protein
VKLGNTATQPTWRFVEVAEPQMLALDAVDHALADVLRLEHPLDQLSHLQLGEQLLIVLVNKRLPTPAERMTTWPVSGDVNTPKNEGPELIEPVAA